MPNTQLIKSKKYCYRLNFKKANMLTLIIKKDYHNWPDILLSSIMVST